MLRDFIVLLLVKRSVLVIMFANRIRSLNEIIAEIFIAGAHAGSFFRFEFIGLVIVPHKAGVFSQISVVIKSFADFCKDACRKYRANSFYGSEGLRNPLHNLGDLFVQFLRFRLQMLNHAECCSQRDVHGSAIALSSR
jgi:hypothetical protein